jgi:hypothetical protein
MLVTLAACGGRDDDRLALPSTTPATAGEAAASAETTTPAAAAPSETKAAATDSPAASGDVSDPCTLLTLDDLEGAFGSRFGPGEFSHQEEVGTYRCMWGGAEGMTVRVFGIAVTVEDELPTAFDDVADYFEQTKTFADVDEELELGDDAYRAGSSLVVLDGDLSYEFSTFTGTSDDAIAGLRTLAEQVIAANG